MTTPALGRLEKVDLRKAWANESTSFTPWLAQPENIALLGEAIDLDLEVEAKEQAVGPFRADILCKDTGSGAWVLVENQLERTDHTHLGQLMTYAAGLDAVTIVWLAEQFTDEHRAALDWLNRITDDKFNFFGLEIELWRISDSPLAPKFNVVSKPNNWSRSVTEAAHGLMSAPNTPMKKQQLEYWTAFRAYAEGTRNFRVQKPLPQNWMNIAIGSSKAYLSAAVTTWDSETNTKGVEIRIDLLMGTDYSKSHFRQLHAQKEAIEREVGLPLKWHNPENKKVCRIYLRNQVDFRDRDQWPAQHRWLVDTALMFKKIFAERVKNLEDREVNALNMDADQNEAAPAETEA